MAAFRSCVTMAFKETHASFGIACTDFCAMLRDCRHAPVFPLQVRSVMMTISFSCRHT